MSCVRQGPHELLIADQLINAWARERKNVLGLE